MPLGRKAALGRSRDAPQSKDGNAGRTTASAGPQNLPARSTGGDKRILRSGKRTSFARSAVRLFFPAGPDKQGKKRLSGARLSVIFASVRAWDNRQRTRERDATALIDGLHSPRYSQRDNVDLAAFHEAFADIVGACFQQLSRCRNR